MLAGNRNYVHRLRIMSGYSIFSVAGFGQTVKYSHTPDRRKSRNGYFISLRAYSLIL